MNTSPAIAFLGAVLPEDMCNNSLACNPAGNKFQLKFIQALRDVSGSMPTVFSVQPIGTYPKSRKILSFADRLDLRDGIRCQLIPFLNIIFLKQLTIGFANLFYLLGWQWRNRKKRRFVFVYNVYPPMGLSVLLATRILGSKSVALVADLPHNMSFDFRGWRGILQRLDVFVETRALAHFSGIIAFTRYIAEDFATHRPMMVMEGGVDPREAILESEAGADGAPQDERILFYSGTLSTINGIELLVGAFRHLLEPDYRLWIFGRGPLESLVHEVATQDKRIVFWGFVPDQEEVLRSQQRATVLINLRLHNHLINRYTFPSKLIEYMLSGRPVISMELPGIPEEYYDFVYVFRGKTPKELANLIIKVCSKPPKELNEFGRRAREFVLRKKNWTVQGQRIYEFICKL